MEKRISFLKEKSFELVHKMTKVQKISLIIGGFIISIVVGTLVYADAGHDSAVPVTVKQSEQVIVRKVGDVDTDAISQEGLSSFFGQITSKDIASVHVSREGVISSWNVSVGDYVSVGQTLGYVTVTGVSPEQQLQLAQQQANALKAELDLETINKITSQTESVFGKIAESLKSVADKQRAIYDGANGSITSTYLTELQAIQARQVSLENKLQDFSNTTLNEVYPLVSQYGQSPFNSGFSETSLNQNLGNKNSSLRNKYAILIKDFATKVTNRSVTDQDIRNFLNKTTDIIDGTLSTEGINTVGIATSVKDLQTELRDISNELSQAMIDKTVKERERSQVEVELAKSLAGFDNDLSLKKLEQSSANDRAKNEAKVAELLAQKLAVSAGGIIPIFATKSGLVASVEKNVGDYVSVSDQIGLISNQNPTKIVRFTIPPSWRDIKKGDSLSISWRPEFAGGSAVITGISPIIDEKGGHQAEARIGSETIFPIGSSVRIVPESSKKGVFVNRKAIVFEGVTPYVWIVTEHDTIRKEAVKPGRQLGEYVEILSGLERGFSYLVILDPTISLTNGKNLSEIIQTKVGSTIKKPIQNESVPHSHDE